MEARPLVHRLSIRQGVHEGIESVFSYTAIHGVVQGNSEQ